MSPRCCCACPADTVKPPFNKKEPTRILAFYVRSRHFSALLVRDKSHVEQTQLSPTPWLGRSFKAAPFQSSTNVWAVAPAQYKRRRLAQSQQSLRALPPIQFCRFSVFLVLASPDEKEQRRRARKALPRRRSLGVGSLMADRNVVDQPTARFMVDTRSSRRRTCPVLDTAETAVGPAPKSNASIATRKFNRRPRAPLCCVLLLPILRG